MVAVKVTRVKNKLHQQVDTYASYLTMNRVHCLLLVKRGHKWLYGIVVNLIIFNSHRR